MLTFVLIHGAWHDGSCWDEVAAHLRNGGHVVHAPTIAGNRRNADVQWFRALTRSPARLAMSASAASCFSVSA